jgi:hypothetical protein
MPLPLAKSHLCSMCSDSWCAHGRSRRTILATCIFCLSGRSSIPHYDTHTGGLGFVHQHSREPPQCPRSSCAKPANGIKLLPLLYPYSVPRKWCIPHSQYPRAHSPHFPPQTQPDTSSTLQCVAQTTSGPLGRRLPCVFQYGSDRYVNITIASNIDALHVLLTWKQPVATVSLPR